MRQTLFYIPGDIDGVPLFGFGILLAVWAVASLLLLAILVRKQGFNAETRSYVPLLGLVGVVIAFVLPHLAEPEGLPLRGYGVMMLLGVVGGVWLSVHRARQMGLDPEVIYSLAFWMFLLGIVGARLFYIIEYWPQFQRDSLVESIGAMVNVPQGGLVVYGSAFGAGLALLLFVYKHRLPGLALADLITPSLMVGLAFGRIGCFLNGCCFGGMCDLPWAVHFPVGSPPYLRQVENGLLYGIQLGVKPDDPHAVVVTWARRPASSDHLPPVCAKILTINGHEVRSLHDANAAIASGRPLVLETDRGEAKVTMASGDVASSLPVHPAQLYSTLDATLICLFLLAYYPFRRRDGELLAWLLTIYPVTRYLIEIIRTDESGMFGTNLSISQIVSLLILTIIALFWVYLLRQPRGVVCGNWVGRS
jgi:phosphatidylglycerol:prolipoprotein diacylglycerol transferase